MDEDEGRLWAATMSSLQRGDLTNLVYTLTRGQPLSAELSFQIGRVIAGDLKFGDFVLLYERKKRRGAPSWSDPTKYFKAALLTRHFIKMRICETEASAVRAASDFMKVDRNNVRLMYPTLGGVPLEDFPEYRAIVEQWEQSAG